MSYLYRHSWDNEAPRSKLRGITELNSEDFSEGEANPVASYGECQVQNFSYVPGIACSPTRLKAVWLRAADQSKSTTIVLILCSSPPYSTTFQPTLAKIADWLNPLMGLA